MSNEEINILIKKIDGKSPIYSRVSTIEQDDEDYNIENQEGFAISYSGSSHYENCKSLNEMMQEDKLNGK